MILENALVMKMDMADQDLSNGIIRVKEVVTKSDVDHFIRLPWHLYVDDPNWVPPLLMERREHLHRKKNPFFEHARAVYWLAYRDNRPVGRITAQIDQIGLEKHQNATGQFGFLEAEDDPDIFCTLLTTAEKWLHSHGMKHVQGPFSFSINDEPGLLVEGFSKPPSLMMGHALPYYGSRLEEFGYTKAKDLIAYDFSIVADGLPTPSLRIANRLKNHDRVIIRNLNKARLSDDVRLILDIFNDAWSDNWGFVPFTESEKEKIIRDFKLLIEPDHVCIIEFEGRPVAFGLTLPNLNEAIADLNGKLFPFGWAKLFYRLKFNKVKTVRLPLMGVRKEFQRSWMGAAMSFIIIEMVHNRNKEQGRIQGELSWVLEDNIGVRRIIESTGCEPYKIYRIYEKVLP
jgi:hypothetical protein